MEDDPMMKHVLAALMAVSLSSAALASGAERGPNGGWKVDAGARHHVEVVLNGTTSVVVYLSDERSQAVPAAGFTANATIVVNGTTHRFALTPADGARMTGTAPAAIPAGSKGAIQLGIPGGSTVRATF